MNLAERYIQGLKQAYLSSGTVGEEKWRHFEETVCGMDAQNKQKLLARYPDIPESLIQILETVDGTYWRKYGDEELAFYFLGSDVCDGEYPYYLYSSDQIINDDNDYSGNFADLFYYYLEDKDNEYGLYVDNRIKTDGSKVIWLCFSDCMNNGGTSSLFIDYTPSESGIKGQIIRYLHDPDQLAVIADSFDEYLEQQISNKFAFIHPELF